MRRRYWFLLVDFFVGFVLFVLGLYFIRVAGDFQLGFGLAIVGAVLLGVLLVLGVLYVAHVKIWILRDAHEF
jgi:hypothetical protein